MNPGDRVRLHSAKGIIDRVVVQDHGDVISICRPESYEQAKAAGVRPNTVGFKKRDIVA